MVGRVEDRLSALPDELLHYILSFHTDIKEVILMSILSKRWKRIWLSVPSINLTRLPYLNLPTKTFTNFVNQVLHFRRSRWRNLNIHTFSLNTGQYNDCPIEKWIRCAELLHAQELYLSLLELKFTPVLRHIKTFSLKFVTLNSNSPGKELLLSFGNVENLMMEDCFLHKIRKLTIHAPLLKFIMIINDYYEPKNQSCVFVLHAPNLTSLEFHGWLHKDYNMGMLDALTTAHIHINIRKMKRYMFDRSLKHILIAISNVKSMTLTANAFQIFSALPKRLATELKKPSNAFHNLKFLKLISWQKEGRIAALGKLLNLFPTIETIVLEGTEASVGVKVEEEDWEAKLSFRCALSHLKTIEVRNFYGCENELKFLDFLVKNSLVLEKVILQKQNMMSLDREKKLVEYCKKLPSHLMVSCTYFRTWFQE